MSIITLTTDFGTQDGYLGAMKGRILSLCPQATIVDISHEIEPQAILAAAWCLVRSTPNFPSGSIHVAVIDPGVGSQRRPLLLKSNDRWYVGPDNGIFSKIVRRYSSQVIYEIHRETERWQAHASFDGLALFAPVAASLANGVALEKLGLEIDEITTFPELVPEKNQNNLRGKIIMFDRFGNAITNIGSNDLETPKEELCVITASQQCFKYVTSYQAGAKETALALINSDGLLELSVYGTSAREKLDLKIGNEVVVESRGVI